MNRRLMTSTLILSFFLLVSCSSVMVMTGKFAAKLMTQKTADLSNAAVSIYYIRNAYPAEANTYEVQYLKDGWRSGDNMIVVQFMKQKGVGMYMLDGTITVDGEVLPHYGNGVYGKWVDRNDLEAKPVRIETALGKVFEFTIGPPPPIEIKSINGQKENATVNLNADLQLELNSPQSSPETEFSVNLISTVMGIRTFLESGVFKYREKIKIPATMWKNSISPVPPETGQNFLKVERFKINPVEVEGIGALQVVNTSNDCVPVTVTGELDKTLFGTTAHQGLTVSEEFKTEHGVMKAQLSKPNAFLGPPLSRAKRAALVSFTVRATKLKQSRTKSSTTTNYIVGTRTTTTTTTTRTFPKLPDFFWENLVNQLYVDFEKNLKSVIGDLTLIPVEQVLEAPSYSKLHAIGDTVTIVEVEKSYKGTKNLIPTKLSEILKDISSTFASDRIDSRLIRELNVDAIIAVTLDLQMPWEEFSLNPKMSLRISGPPNGYKAGPTIFVQGTITGNGMPLEEAKMNAKYLMDVLPNVIRQQDLMHALTTSLNAMKEKERTLGYNALWELK